MDLIFNEDTKQFELAKQPYKTVEIRCETEEDYNNFEKILDLSQPRKPIKSDVQEIKHGKWVLTGNALGYTECHCSECDNYLFLDSKDDELYNYCPYCGAKMDKE